MSALQLLHRRVQAARGLLGELGDADIADVAVLDMAAHRLHLDDGAGDLVVLQLFLGAAGDLQRHRGADRPAHLVDRLIERHALRRGAVDGGDDVAGHQARLGGRRVVDRRDHLDEPVLLGHLDAEAAELALGRTLHLAIGVGVHVAGMRVERRQHAVDRRIDQLALVRLLDVIVANLLEHVAEQIELAIGLGGGGVGFGRDGLQSAWARGMVAPAPSATPNAR